jgi:hypothetical protein
MLEWYSAEDELIVEQIEADEVSWSIYFERWSMTTELHMSYVL